jgi:general stress protein YciG
MTPPAEAPAADKPKSARGTAAMDPETRREVARKGGLAVSRNRNHMAQIGKKGGQSISRDRDHMAKIGKKGGETSRTGRRSHEDDKLSAIQPQELSELERKKAV